MITSEHEHQLLFFFFKQKTAYEMATRLEFRRVLFRSEPGDRTGPQVVPVREAAGQDHRVDGVQVGVAVPQRHRLGTGDPYRPEGVGVVQRAGEGDHPDSSHADSNSSTRTVKSSITGLASSLSAICRAASRSACGSDPSPNSISIRLPMRTDDTPVTPSRGRAFVTASPCGSRISGLSMTSTMTRATRRSCRKLPAQLPAKAYPAAVRHPAGPGPPWTRGYPVKSVTAV